MPRAHVEFVFAQNVQWAASRDLPGRDGLSRKLLSLDDLNGEFTAVFELPPGWRMTVESPFQEEIYVLDGELEIAGRRLQRDGYFRLSARAPHRWKAPHGAIVLLFANVASPENDAPLVAIDAVALDWSTQGVPAELDFMRLARKALFVEAVTGHMRTWLLSVAPQTAARGDTLAVETHDCAEEVFILSGDITGPQGAMTPGAYFWRPRDTLHGPFGSRNGGMAISRWRHGLPVTTFHAGNTDFTFEAPYDPILPLELGSAMLAPTATARF